MQRDEIRQMLIKDLLQLAPDIEADAIDDNLDLSEQCDLDSVDILNFILKVQKDFGITIENRDYQAFFNLKAAQDFLLNQNIGSRAESL